MKLRFFPEHYSVCQLPDLTGLNLSGGTLFFAKTGDELSLVCETHKVPENAIRVEGGWRMFRVEGLLDFSLVGILSAITGVLAENKISVFAVSTYATDYLLIKAGNVEKAKSVLVEAGYESAE